MNNDDVSRKHAVLYKDATGSVVIEDLGSTNGTFVNGNRVTKQVLRAGDKVTITRNYPLSWETVFGGAAQQPAAKKSSSTLLFVLIPLLVVLFIGTGVGVYFGFFHEKKYSSKEIYEKYNSSVCWVYVQFGYKIMLDGQDITSFICEQADVTAANYVHFENGKLVPGMCDSQGTAFFISEDGKMATNLHVVKPWMFSNDIEVLEQGVNAIVSQLAKSYPQMHRSRWNAVQKRNYSVQEAVIRPQEAFAARTSQTAAITVCRPNSTL
jgi:hypothetical protein